LGGFFKPYSPIVTQEVNYASLFLSTAAGSSGFRLEISRVYHPTSARH